MHRKCTSLTLVNLYKHLAGKNPFYCKFCRDSAIPFSAEDDESLDLPNTKNHGSKKGVVFDPNHLNTVFSCNNTEPEGGIHEWMDEGFQPIPDKYFSADNIPFDDYDIDMSGKNSKKFSAIGVNIRSLANVKNFAKLQLFIHSLCFQPSVIAINETNLRDNGSGPHCSLSNYHFISNCRKIHTKYNKGGGVGIYALDSLDYIIREDLTIMEDKIFESLFIEIKCSNKSILYGTIYRKPDKTSDSMTLFLNYLKKVINIISKSNKPCIIQGDFNLDLVDIDDNHTNLFTDIMFNHTFYPHINKPTRLTKTSATCIDHIWSNIYDTDIVGGIISETVADHLIPFLYTDINICNSPSSTARPGYEKIEYDKLGEHFLKIKTEDIMSCNDIDVKMCQNSKVVFLKL